MGEILKKLYAIRPKDFLRTGQVFGRAFENDPAWKDIFKDTPNEKRDAFFEGPARYCYKYGNAYGLSDELEGIAAWVPGQLADMTFWRILNSGLIKSSRKLGMGKLKEILPMSKPMEKTRREHLKGLEYIYLMTLGVDPVHQGKGVGSRLLQGVIEEANEKVVPLYLETATPRNVSWYKKSGFKVVDEIIMAVAEKPQWCMIRKPD